MCFFGVKYNIVWTEGRILLLDASNLFVSPPLLRVSIVVHSIRTLHSPTDDLRVVGLLWTTIKPLALQITGRGPPAAFEAPDAISILIGQGDVCNESWVRCTLRFDRLLPGLVSKNPTYRNRAFDALMLIQLLRN